MIRGELCKRGKFDNTTKWYKHKPESVLENEAHIIPWDFEIQSDHLILARRPDLELNNRKKWTCYLLDFTVPAEWKIKESENRNKYLDLARELRKLRNIRMTMLTTLKKSNTRRKNMTIVWIDNKNVYDIDLKSWIVDNLKIYKIHKISDKRKIHFRHYH